MKETTYNFLIVGLPEAGKTSFIYAVDELLQNPPSKEALRGYALASDRSYLEQDKWKYRAGKKFEHTPRKIQGAPPELLFEHVASGLRGRLFLPDVNGEVFQDQWIDRKWAESYGEDLRNIDGVLLFMRSDKPSTNQELLGAMANLLPNGKKGSTFDPKKASPQVQLVEVLQFIAVEGQISRPQKVAVLISAWDTVEKPQNRQPKKPAAFLAREWPLLDQYLRSNPETFRAKIYGVSALGGTEQELKELSKLPPQDRVKIVEDGAAAASQDLTRPLRWLLGMD